MRHAVGGDRRRGCRNCAPWPPRAMSPRCGRAARCPRWWRPTTTASMSSSSAARAGGSRRSWPRWSPASSPARSASRCPRSLIEVDPALGAAEPDAEIQDLIAASHGANVGLDFLPGSLPYTPAAGLQPTPEAAAETVWLDALVTNVDRTPRNPNLLVWHDRVWLIDHGAALYLHHRDWSPERDAALAFPAIRDHVLLPGAGSVHDADERLAPRLPADAIRAAVDLVPADWIDAERYVDYLTGRLASPRAFAAEAERARL